MRVRTPPLARWVGTAGTLSIEAAGVVLDDVADSWPFEDLVEVAWHRGAIWGDLRLRRLDGRAWTATLSQSDGTAVAEVITHAARVAVRRRLTELAAAYQSAAQALRDRLTGQEYLRVGQWRSAIADLAATFAPWASHPMLQRDDIQQLPSEAQWWLQLVREPERAIEGNNARWAREEIKRHTHFFDSMGTRGLTDEQRRACVDLAGRALVSAAAGSGKTATLVGKVGYLLLAGHAQPEEILLLAFNKSAADEIGERIARELAPILRGRTVKARTFHGFGLEVLGEATGRKPTVYEPDVDGGANKAWSTAIDRLTADDARFAAEWWTFRALFLKPAADPVAYRSVEEWEAYVDRQGTSSADRRRGFLTLKGEIVKSQGELAIANWLALKGVPYQYERPYEYETADKMRRQYHPDFYLPAIKTYIEHFAIDATGNPPPAFGDEYARSMQWKRVLHQDKGTQLIETTYAQFRDGTLFETLEQTLLEAGQPIEAVPKWGLIETLKAQQEVLYPLFLTSVVVPFVSHAKNNRIPIRALEDGTCTDARGSFRERLFCRLMARLIGAYEARLRAGNLVDFDDMVVMAADAVLAGKYRSPFKVVLVDEFQDISQARAQLVKALVDQRQEAMLVGVGDVHQAIYRFAGSDVAVFRDFGAVFGSVVKLYLTRTFRFNQGIADVASAFVGVDDGQVVSDDARADRVVRIRLYEKRDAQSKATVSALEEIATEVKAEGKRSASVLILYRVNAIGKALGALPDFGVLRITKLSIHRAKGLEADYVVLAGVVGSGAGAFPSGIADDELLQLVMPQKEVGAAEERRLMYVSLTRGRRAAYVVASSSQQSSFVDELIAMQPAMAAIDVRRINGEALEICPGCGKGTLVPREGAYGRFFGCSRYPRCKETRQLAATRRRRT